jgi:hypothetical protein
MAKQRFILSALLMYLVLAPSLFVGNGNAVRLIYKLQKGTHYNYTLEEEQKVSIDMMGQSQVIESGIKRYIGTTVENVAPNGDITYQFVYDSANVRTPSQAGMESDMMEKTMKREVGVRVRATVTTQGQRVKGTLLDSLPPMPGEEMTMMGSDSLRLVFAFFLYPLPSREVKPGDTWKDHKVDSSVAMMNGKMKVITDIEYNVAGYEQVGNYNCLKVIFAGKGTSMGKMTMGNMEMSIESSETIQGTVLFAPQEGLLISKEEIRGMESTTTISGQQEGVMPSSGTMKSKLTFVGTK